MILDTSAWVEFFEGTEKGRRVANALENERNFTNAGSVAELVEWCIRSGNRDKMWRYMNSMQELSTIVGIDQDMSLIAGRVNEERKKTVKNWGMMDSFVLSTSLMYGMKILTKDHHFADLPNAEVI